MIEIICDRCKAKLTKKERVDVMANNSGILDVAGMKNHICHNCQADLKAARTEIEETKKQIEEELLNKFWLNKAKKKKV